MDDRKEAANHFAHYLFAVGKLSQKNTSLKIDDLKAEFSENYQPQYNMQCLEMRNLVPTLAKAGLLEKPSADKSLVNFKWNRIQEQDFRKGELPEKPSPRLTKPKQRIIVSQRYTEGREKQERPDGLSPTQCDICKVHFNGIAVEEHKKDEIHILRSMYRKNRRSFDDTKHILAVTKGETSEQTQAGMPLKVSCRVGLKHELSLEFTNMTDEKAIDVEKIVALITHKDVQLQGFTGITIQPGQKFAVKVVTQFSARFAVLFPLIVCFYQSGINKIKYFLLDIEFRVQSETMDQLAPSRPYTCPMGPILKLQNAPRIPGRPASNCHHELEMLSPLKKQNFEIPPIFLRFLNNGFKPHPNMTPYEQAKLEEVRSLLPKGSPSNFLTYVNYHQLFELLLFIEEHQMTRDIHHYDMHCTDLVRKQEGLWLNVPGLVDKRPSLLINDVVLINFIGDDSVAYEGYINRINGSQVLLGLHHKFEDNYTGQQVQVRFQINRHVIRSMHRALYIVAVNQAPSLFFPCVESKPLQQPPLRPWFNKDIGKNPEQQAAVRNIVHNSAQNSPYLVFGPPGTGKTVTLVEAILQLWNPKTKNTRILVCTPSNAAADEITLRLLKTIESAQLLKPGEAKVHILRMCAMSRTLDQMPSPIIKAGITNHEPRTGLSYFPRVHVIMSYDIVISTFANIYRLVLAPMKPGHFTHIIMDEVGQALEPEALIPLSGLATSKGSSKFVCQVVMAGDPKQLGPILQSSFAAGFGLETSMLERLMSLPLYSKKPSTNRYDPHVLTKLVLNYRSHSAILKVPNDLFYDGELKAVGDKNVTDSICKWQGLRKKDFPLIFHGVEGLDEREGSSPSFFNRQEIEVVIDYLKRILSDKLASASDIGIVTPYNQQVKKIRRACEIEKLADIDVGSVEQFQGQERKVIIISTVRSRFQFVAFDHLFQLGFLRNPKRFNVAVTRARSLLVVVGNPNVLQHDTCWRTLLKHCINNDSYIGMPFNIEPLQSHKTETPEKN